MKKLAVLLIAAIALSGCAFSGYQEGELKYRSWVVAPFAGKQGPTLQSMKSNIESDGASSLDVGSEQQGIDTTPQGEVVKTLADLVKELYMLQLTAPVPTPAPAVVMEVVP